MICKKIALSAFILLLSAGLVSPKIDAAHALLGPVEAVEQNPFYKKIAAAPAEGKTAVNIKIQYLISRVRKSPYKFIRNSESHDGKRAASHLAMKYSFASGRIKNVQEFIEHVAARSSVTGEVYLIEIEGEKMEFRKVLKNELAFLEEKLKNPSV